MDVLGCMMSDECDISGAECLRGGTFEGKNPSPEEANTRVRLSILYGVPIVNK
jgi:hypothetical protein